MYVTGIKVQKDILATLNSTDDIVFLPERKWNWRGMTSGIEFMTSCRNVE